MRLRDLVSSLGVPHRASASRGRARQEPVHCSSVSLEPPGDDSTGSVGADAVADLSDWLGGAAGAELRLEIPIPLLQFKAPLQRAQLVQPRMPSSARRTVPRVLGGPITRTNRFPAGAPNSFGGGPWRAGFLEHLREFADCYDPPPPRISPRSPVSRMRWGDCKTRRAADCRIALISQRRLSASGGQEPFEDEFGVEPGTAVRWRRWGRVEARQ